MNSLLRRSAAHVFVDSLATPVLSSDDEHHLGRVLRIRPSDPITVSDGAGAWRPATWSLHDGVTPTGEIDSVAPGSPSMVASAIPKGDRPEWMVQKLTELGIDRIAFFHSARSVVRWEGDRGDRQVERMRRVAREAAAQSRRVWLPTVELLSWAEVEDVPGLALADPDGAACPPGIAAIAIGPEGGFTDAELSAGVTVALSEQVLRVETAALVAGVVVAGRHAASQP